MLLGGGGDGDESSDSTTALSNSAPVVVTAAGAFDTDSPEETDAAATTEPAELHRCTSRFGRCAFIDEITRDGDTFTARYTTTGYDPKLNGGPESRHVHFYFDTLPVTQAGIPAPTNWVAYDTDRNGELLYEFSASDVPAGATKLCASVANVNHGLDDHLQDCMALP